MTKIAVQIFVIVTITISLFRPWVGSVACYLLGIGAIIPLWSWVFVRSRIVFYIALSTIFGFIGAVIYGKIDFASLKSKQNFYLLVLWICFIISYIFSPYEITPTTRSIEDASYIIQNMSKVLLFYFISVLIIDNKTKLHYLVWVILFSASLLIYWGNMEYFQGHMRAFRNTLMGPGSEYVASPYVDENAFAMFFIMTIPFLFFMGSYYKNKALKWFLWLNIPFAWHCIFLTGSRGGLLGLSVVTFYIAIRSRSKILTVAIPIALAIAFIYQGGASLHTRTQSVLNIEEDASAQNRFDSWETGLKMIIDHPVTGVGVGNFLRAYPDYSDKRPFVAHNTFVQFASESGIVAGLVYLFICFGIFWKNLKYKKSEALNIDPFILAVRESLTGSLVGFFICALFLNVGTYEIFYYILLLNSVQTRLANTAL